MEQALTQPSRPRQVSIANPVPVVNRTPLQAVDHHLASGSPTVAYLPTANSPTSLPAGDLQADGAGFGSLIQDPGDVDPGDETPGRSPRRTTTHPARAAKSSSQQIASRERNIADSHALLAGSSDPLGEGLGLLAGMAIGLLTLVVPLLSVITDRPANQGLPVVETPFDPSHLP